MRCPRRRTLQAYLDSELPEKRAKGTEGHLAECRTCRDTVARMRADKDVARETLRRFDPARIPIPALGPDGAPEIYPRTERIRPRPAVAFLPAPATALLMAGLFLAGLFLGITLRGGAANSGHVKGNAEPALFYFPGGDAVRAVSLNLDLGGYRPLDEPRVIVITEERK